MTVPTGIYSLQVNLGFGNALVDDIFFVSGYDIRGSVMSQVICFTFMC